MPDPAACTKRREAARTRAARETSERAKRAKATLDVIDKERAKRAQTSPKEIAESKAPRASLTDPDARRMRCADGAVRAAYNVQFATTADCGFITAVAATNRRNDSGLARPMLEQTERRLGRQVARLLADTGYAATDDIAALAARPDGPVTAYIWPPKDQDNVKPETLKAREKLRAKEPGDVKEWRKRMATEDAKMVMKRRGSIERVNAQTKNRGLGVMPVSGLIKVQAVALLHALSHNLVTALRCRAAMRAA